jgi:GntR family transcriptional regulator/MocR family aminotransferase
MNLELDKQGTLYEQIARALKRAIREGELVAGSRLPSTRSLAMALQVSRKPVIEAYELLCAEQVAVARTGSGTRVAKVPAAARSERHAARVRPTTRYVERARTLGPVTLDGFDARIRFNMQCGAPLVNPHLFNSWRRKLAAAALRAGPTYPPAAGFLPLRQALAEYLVRRRGIACSADDIVIVGGTQQALSLAARVLINEGDPVVLEDPFYQLAMHAWLAHGAAVTSVPTDEQGLVVAQLPERPTRMVYVTPHQFPSGTVLSLSRRVELVHWAAQHDCWIFEDAYEGEFHHGRGFLPALRSLDLTDRVLYVGSFSKTLFPSLRLGFIVCPKGLRDDFVRAKMLDDMGSPAIEQAALATFIRSGQYEAHLRSSFLELEKRRLVLFEVLERSLSEELEITKAHGGMHLVAWLRRINFEQCEALVAQAARMGLRLHPIHPYYRVRPARPGLLLGYAGLMSHQLRAAVDILKKSSRDSDAHDPALTAAHRSVRDLLSS